MSAAASFPLISPEYIFVAIAMITKAMELINEIETDSR